MRPHGRALSMDAPVRIGQQAATLRHWRSRKLSFARAREWWNARGRTADAFIKIPFMVSQ